MTKDGLIGLGVDYDKGLALCMNNEALYFKLIDKVLTNPKFEGLEENIGKNDLEAAFEDAHALKGVAGNLAMTSLYTLLDEITEALRAKQADFDYQGSLAKILAKRGELAAL